MTRPFKASQSRKMWPSPSPIYRDIQLSDAEWEAINHYVELPDEARQQVQEAINDYRYESALSGSQRPRPSDLKIELTRLIKLAKELKSGLDNPSSFDLMMIIGSVDRSPGPYARASYVTHYEDTRQLAETLLKTLEQAPFQLKNNRRGANTAHIDKLLAQLDLILTLHGKTGVNHHAKTLKYVSEAFKVADTSVGDGSLHEAILRHKSRS